MLEVNNINVSYQLLQVLWDVSFEIDEGEIVLIIGSNGAGKTTLINAISGFVPLTSGSCVFLGEKINSLHRERIVSMGISQVPEGRRIFPYMSVLENLELGAYCKEARKRKEENLEQVLKIFPVLKERSKQLGGTLSGGEQQMLAMARGIMSNPKLLMLDEPSLGLAPILVQKNFETIKEINKTGITILLVEQNVNQAAKISDRAYVLESGRITLHGASHEILQNDHVRKAYLGI